MADPRARTALLDPGDPHGKRQGVVCRTTCPGWELPRFRADGTQASVAFRVRPSACVFPANQRGEMYVYLADSATRRQISALGSEIAEMHAQGLVKSFWFVSKAQALAQLKCELSDPSILSLLPDNPLPASFDVIPTRASYDPRIAAALRHMAGIDRTMPGNGIFYS